MMWFKMCPRCSGVLADDRDRHGAYIFCMRCGYYLSDAQIAGLRVRNSHLLRTAAGPLPTALSS
jgi:hypothetical protein